MFDASYGRTVVGALFVAAIIIAVVAFGIGALVGWMF